MFWFIFGALTGIYGYHNILKVDHNPLTNLVLAEELQKKHEFLSNYYTKIIKSSDRRSSKRLE